jgi:hypothetical protein
VTAQSAFGERCQPALNDRHHNNWFWEHYSYEIAALEGALDGAIAALRHRAARHVHLIRDRHFDGLCGSGSATGSGKQSNGNGNQSGQARTSEIHRWTIWRYGLRVNGVHGALM